MAVLRIAKMGNPILLRKAERVADPTAPEIRQLAADMQETLEDIGASGLAAPQVFVPKRVVVYRMIAARIPAGSGIQPRPWTVMVNPVITPKTDKQTPVWERCLSVPGLHGKVPRYLNINIRYQTLDGRSESYDAHSSWAALLQHECDHLDGVLFPQRMTDLTLLAYNDEPGPLAREVHENPKGIDPLFIDLVERWPGRGRWFPGTS
jgi:peptide deformylase